MTPPVYAASNVTPHITVLPLGGYAGYSFFCIICCLPVVDVTQDRLWERHPSPLISRCVSHTLVSNASYSSFLMPPSTCEWATVTARERDRKGKGRGRKRRTLERAVYFARLTENSQKCWDGIMLTNTDCDFLGGKQPALVNLEWLWTNVDPCPHHVKCHNRNAPQQFICILQIHIYVKWQVTSQNFSLSVTLGQFSTTLSVCSLVQH